MSVEKAQQLLSDTGRQLAELQATVEQLISSFNMDAKQKAEAYKVVRAAIGNASFAVNSLRILVDLTVLHARPMPDQPRPPEPPPSGDGGSWVSGLHHQ